MTATLIFFGNLVLFAGSGLFLLMLAVSSVREGAFRAGIIAFFLLAADTLFWVLVITTAPLWLNLGILALAGGFIILSGIRFFLDPVRPRDVSFAVQYDERDHMFARNNLKHHPDLAEIYYDMHPENKSRDRQIHNKPDFGDPGQVYYDPYTTPCYEAAFAYLHQTIPASMGEPAPKPVPVDTDKLVSTITDLVRFHGGCDTGFVRLAPHHFYSHRGRHAADWGTPADQTHHSAIVIVVPMNIRMLKHSPTATVIQESAGKYVEAAKISNIVAGYLRRFGYQARAHNDGNYEVLCVPPAVASGLGELGRMGIFMHHRYGPCVRLAVVTTTLDLPDSGGEQRLYMEHFCRICKKCADNCPSGSITTGKEQESRNFPHWSIDQEKCFSYWKTIGSDCGMCISVCPYTKPDTLVHRLVRFYISKNSVNQRIALFMDDLLYGRRKKIAKTNPVPLFRQSNRK
jgi:reductive dehalogenase